MWVSTSFDHHLLDFVCHLLPSLCCRTERSAGVRETQGSWFAGAEQPRHVSSPPPPSACPFGTGGQYWSTWKSPLGSMADINFEAAKQTMAYEWRGVKVSCPQGTAVGNGECQDLLHLLAEPLGPLAALSAELACVKAPQLSAILRVHKLQKAAGMLSHPRICMVMFALHSLLLLICAVHPGLNSLSSQ